MLNIPAKLSQVINFKLANLMGWTRKTQGHNVFFLIEGGIHCGKRSALSFYDYFLNAHLQECKSVSHWQDLHHPFLLCFSLQRVWRFSTLQSKVFKRVSTYIRLSYHFEDEITVHSVHCGRQKCNPLQSLHFEENLSANDSFSNMAGVQDEKLKSLRMLSVQSQILICILAQVVLHVSTLDWNISTLST